jgi:pimeloyl-ACP methyl ester carboxylesterase
MEPRRTTVAGDGIQLAVWERGDRSSPTVVLVHGYPDTHAVPDGVAAALAVDHHVVTPDVRGAGDSPAPADPSGYDLHHLVADLRAVIDDTSPDDPVHLVGHDWGSIQGWEAVLSGRLAGRLLSFTSISGPDLGHVSQWVRDRLALRPTALGDLLRQGARSWYVAAFQLPLLPELAWRTGMPRRFAEHLRRSEGAVGDRHPAPTLAADGANGVQLYRRNIGPRSATSEPRTTDLPVLLVVPTGDRFVTPALLDDLGRYVPNLTRCDVDGGHWIVATEPHLVAGMIRDHVAART